MLTYALWYLGIGLVYTFINVLKDGKEIPTKKREVVLIGATAITLTWPFFVLTDVVSIIIWIGLYINYLLTKGSK